MNNKVSAEITDLMMADFKKDIEAIKAKYPWLISLTPEERLSGTHLGEKSISFATKTYDYIGTNPEYLPSYINKVEANRDFSLWSNINQMLRVSNILTDSLNDTAMQAGFEAMEVALAYYNSVKEAAKRNAPGAQTIYEDLRTRFPGQKAKATTKPPTK
ncbi:hypothetical protein [uncultured Acetobacteroides sp.]|uniref:hypothetical protein n=1 Tax=uncultured Acetobacteroides sp. TaxID=1760811 RepID=UPI0029F4F60E|nr:hypothetical protein [uncultured Acetobacteroides sp.]